MIQIFYRPNSEYGRDLENFTKRLEERRIKYEMIDVDTRGGSAKAQAYDIMQYPTVLAVRETGGQVIQSWMGILPTVADVEYYAYGSV